ncbi:MAG: thiamine phosphate synthase [Coriobacteriia bacterium]|nr:thiamine phosphate synthase [Coriobacteriia bacterium]
MSTGRSGGRASSAARVHGLYFVTASHPERGRDHADLATAAIEGGARAVQFRDKELCGEEFMRQAKTVRDVCRRLGAAFVVNDDAEVAMELRADGLHLGQSDLAGLAVWRPTWDAFLGISATTLTEARAAIDAGAGYLGVGPVFPTGSKADAAPPIGIEGLRAICSAVDVPVAAIGGIGRDEIAGVVTAGADAVCVISAVSLAPDPRAAATTLTREYETAAGLAALESGDSAWG